jgi:multisubunit Na+/H+ antiporter MnhC subunit
MRELRDTNPVGLATVGTAVTLLLLVAGVGAVGLWARYVNTWRSFFFMERVTAAAAPVTIALLAALVVSGAVLIVRSR